MTKAKTNSNSIFKLLVLLLVLNDVQSDETLDYVNQNLWTGICNTGTLQSPIDIVPSSHKLCPTGNQFYFTMPNTSFIFKSSGPNLKTDFIAKSKIQIEDSLIISSYESTQFVWHSPSEHTIRGKKLDLQWQIYHKELNDPTKIAVVSILFKIDEFAKTDIFDKVNFFKNSIDQTFDWSLELDSKLAYRYKGSLTTPPCTENVNWFVYSVYLPIKKANYYRMKAAINNNQGNSRNIQTAGSRTLQTLGGFCNDLYI